MAKTATTIKKQIPTFVWEVVFKHETPEGRVVEVTYRAEVPGGWIYRHLNIPIEKVDQFATMGLRPPSPAEVACESMVFVPKGDR